MTLFDDAGASPTHPNRSESPPAAPRSPLTPPTAPPVSKTELVLQFDGGSRGNPGPAGIGVTLVDFNGRPVYELGEFLGRCTNNVAEYTALVRGLTAAKRLGAKKVVVRSDSELVVRQVNGQYKVKSPDLKPLFQKAVALMKEIGDVKVHHVFREGNTRADKLANLAMDSERKIEPLGPPDAG
jgi:ribonuclease HI